jgi:hypothetical protein
VKAFASCDELNDTAKEVIATAVKVASGKSPEDLLCVANWLRNEANVRLTPQVLLVVASRFDGTKSLVRKYAPHVARRPDDVKACLLAHRFLFGMKSLPNGLALGLADAVAKFGERGLMKYDAPGFPTWKDVLCWLPRKAGWPLPAEVAKYFVTGKMVDPSKTPVIAARKELAQRKVFDAEARALAKRSFVNWEVLLSQFPGERKDVWSFLVDEKLVGYMAMLRNVRNILQSSPDAALVAKVSAKLSDKDEVKASRQMPFRFLAAYRAVSEMGLVDEANLGELMAAVELAANEACASVPALPGTTVIFADNSGSMGDPVSEKSGMSCKDAANMLAGIVAKVAERPYVCSFGEDLREIRFAKTDTVIGIAEKIRGTEVGGSTNGYKCVEWLMEKDIVPDRVILLSDQQLWRDPGSKGGWGEPKRLPFCDLWAEYRKGKKTWLHSAHLNGYGDSPVDEGIRVNQVSGFTEKVFTMMLRTEGLAGPDALPTVEQIRKDWRV